MKISVITVCYNSGSTIKDCLRSVASQEGVDFEHVIIDGNSKDGTQDIIRDFISGGSAATTFISEPDGGIYDAMNKGIRLSKGDVVGFLNADDLFASKDTLKRVAERFSSADVDGCYGDLDLVDQSDLSKTIRHWKSGVMPASKMLYGWHPAHPTFYVRRQFIAGDSGFRTKYKIAADYELMTRLIMLKNLRLVYLPEILVKMRVGGASNGSIKNILRANQQCVAAWRDNGLRLPVFLIPGKLLWKLSQRLGSAMR